MSASFEFSDVERITVGTVGEPGQRTFYLQIRQADQLVTLKLEKQQVAALAQLLAEMLSDLPAAESPAAPAAELEEPVIAEWPVGDMQLSYDTTLDRIVILAEEVTTAVEEPESAIGEPLGEEPSDELSRDEGVARIAITRDQAAALIIRSAQLVAAGRPTCPLCGNPIDPTGHACPRTNGHAPRASS
ncbi:MAG: DUF3090 family protein [Acidimicrobiaceae bacterium]|nr:DUF3090 family protein [Acidimicrobiaceae bacterium]